jgi:predicted dehydrogenase
MCPGHERWHPNPAFYYDVGGGPMLDMGPYYITDLVNLLGPVATVVGVSSKLRNTRTITAKERAGEVIPVHVPTHVAGSLIFANGAIVQVSMSFDVAGHKHLPLEIYGTEGTLIVPDPNHFGGQVQMLKKGGDWQDIATDQPYWDGNFRSIGLADMASSLIAGRKHRCSGDLALHVLEVMEAFEVSARSQKAVEITTTLERPEPLSTVLVNGALA